MIREFLTIKGDLTVPPLAHIGQFPLPRGLRNLPADEAVQRIASQNDLGAAGINEDFVQNPRVMVVEKPKPRQMIRILTHSL